MTTPNSQDSANVPEQPVADPPKATASDTSVPPATLTILSMPDSQPSFRQALTAGVNRLATALDDLDSAVGRRATASTAVDDARAQVTAAQAQMQAMSASVDDARSDTLAAFDTLGDTLAAGRVSIMGS